MEKLTSLLGLFVMISIAYGLSENRKKIAWKTVVGGIPAQLVFGFLSLKTHPGLWFFDQVKVIFESILNYSLDGSRFLFGPLTDVQKFGFIFFVMVLPTIIFTSTLMSVLYHIGLMEKVVKFIAKIMIRFMKTSGAESLAAAANIFAGQTEAPLVIKPYIAKMTKSELLSLMVGGMATIAGGVLTAYVGLGINAGHLLAASVMSAPAALCIAKLMVPETQKPATSGEDLKASFPKTAENVIDAAVVGASDGLSLALNVGAMLLAFIALVALLNGGLGWFGGLFGVPQLSFELILGYIFSPFALIMGVPWDDAMTVGSLLGKKTVLNEFVAYMDLKDAILSDRAKTIATYALCGFANFGSIGIQVGGIGSLVPERRKDFAKLGVKALIGGTLACFMTACIAGIFI
ncbi:MAG: NupC/NupG family nucleoside CNT transporter [Bdellovibrionota bacterium]